MKAITLIAIFAVFTPLAFCLTGDTFTVNCAPLTQQRSDPIVYPGIASAHTHNVVGGDAFQRTMGPTAALQADQTSCDKSIDRSNYWVPAMYHQRTDKMWELVPWLNTAVYYQKRACNYAPGKKSCEANFLPLAFPDGFRMLAGNPYRRTQNSSDFTQKSVMIMCIYDGGSSEHYGFPTRQCNLMRAEVYFPSCWDGKNVDSPTHTTHTAYPAIGDYNGGVCPASHPVAIMSLFYEFIFDTSSFKDINRFAFACGDPTGYGFHGDFIMGWTNRALLQTAHADCINAQDCPKLGQQGQTPRKLQHPAIYEEEIGLHGPITKLPGNNSVVWPSQERVFV